MKTKIIAIWRVILSNEFVSITPFGINAVYMENSGSTISEIGRIMSNRKRKRYARKVEAV